MVAGGGDGAAGEGEAARPTRADTAAANLARPGPIPNPELPQILILSTSEAQIVLIYVSSLDNFGMMLALQGEEVREGADD